MNNSDIDLLTIETLSERPDLTGVTRDMIKEFLLLPDSWVLKIEGAEPERLPSFLQDELALLPNWPAPPDGLVAVALFGLKPAGTAQIRRIDGRICELKRMFVREEFQQLGVGRQLVKFLTDWGRKLSYGEMYLDVTPNRTGSIKFYEALGFERCPTLHDYGDTPIVSMTKPTDLEIQGQE